MIENRYGIILFPRRDDVEFDLKNRQVIFQEVIPIRSILDELRFGQPVDKMLCWSEKFDIIKEGEMYSEYTVCLERYLEDHEDHTSEKIRIKSIERVK